MNVQTHLDKSSLACRPVSVSTVKLVIVGSSATIVAFTPTPLCNHLKSTPTVPMKRAAKLGCIDICNAAFSLNGDALLTTSLQVGRLLPFTCPWSSAEAMTDVLTVSVTPAGVGMTMLLLTNDSVFVIFTLYPCRTLLTISFQYDGTATRNRRNDLHILI